MITAKPRLYYNTGLEVGDTPYTLALFESWQIPYIDLDDHVSLQDALLGSFRLKVAWSTVKNADYMRFGDNFYWITPKMINENCAEIFCQQDAALSMGGVGNLNYTGGTITRAHPLQVSSLDNVIPDIPQPANILRAIVHPISLTTGGADNDLTVIASTVKLDDPNVSLAPNIERDALVFSGQTGLTADSKYTIAIPKAPAPSSQTALRAIGKDIETVGYGLYDANNATVKTNLEYLRSLGLSDAILFSYRIPKSAVSFNVSANGFITFLYGGTNAWTNGANIPLGFSITNGNSNYLPKYYKTYLNNRTITIRGRLSGDVKTFKPYEILSPGEINPGSNMYFQYTVDPNYQGTTYCAPQYYYQNDDTYTKIGNAAKGLQWAENPISIQAVATREAWNQRAMDLSENGILGIDSLGGLSNLAGRGIATNALGFLSNMYQGLGNVYLKATGSNARYNFADGMINMDPQDYEKAKADMKFVQSKVGTPLLTSSPAFGLQNYVDNTFDIIEVRPTDADLIQIDKYYERYGYAQPNIVFNKNYLNSRPSFNYIQGSGIKIAPNNYGRALTQACEAQINGGCTIWHIKPTQNYSN